MLQPHHNDIALELLHRQHDTVEERVACGGLVVKELRHVQRNNLDMVRFGHFIQLFSCDCAPSKSSRVLNVDMIALVFRQDVHKLLWLQTSLTGA